MPLKSKLDVNLANLANSTVDTFRVLKRFKLSVYQIDLTRLAGKGTE
jgi:hypothetical protein